MSPEIFSNQPYGQKSDIWALGCCAYEMATLEHAFTAGDISSLVLKIVRGQTPTLPSANTYSKPLLDLINSMLDKTADNRPTAQQILQQPYVKQHVSRLFKKIQQRNESNNTTPVRRIQVRHFDENRFFSLSSQLNRHYSLHHRKMWIVIQCLRYLEHILHIYSTTKIITTKNRNHRIHH